MKYIYLLILINFSVLVHGDLRAQSSNKNNYLFTQKVNRFTSIVEPWHSYRGEIMLSNTEIVFSPKNTKNRGAFILEYKNILTVKKRFLIIFPNSIVITDKNYAKYKIGTYKRKRIVNTIRSKIEE